MHFPLLGVQVSAYGDANRGAGVRGIVHIAIDWLILIIFAVGKGGGASQLKDCRSFSSGRTGVTFVFFTLYYL